jgi:hypothetical protein
LTYGFPKMLKQDTNCKQTCDLILCMSQLFKKHEPQCFFCHSTVSNPRDPSNFRCTTCGCLNRYDAFGEIVSSEPAMFDETLNSRSFSRRGPLFAMSTSMPTQLRYRFSSKRPNSNHVWHRAVLSHLPNEPNAACKPVVKLSTTNYCQYQYFVHFHRN